MTQEEFHKRYQYNLNTDCLGEGGFGKVYKAYDTHLDRYVALKIAEVKQNYEEVRLKKEVELINKLPTHPNIAHYEECYSFLTYTGEYDYGVLQYYKQGNLQQLLDDEHLTYEQKDSILKQILEGIVFLHSQGIIHRDLKPQNILIALNQKGDYIPKITDFGISKKLDINKSSVFTNSLAGAGTLSFASPEQLTGLTIRKNTDLWSFGVITCLMFTGKLPFNTGNQTVTSEAGRIELFKQITDGDITSTISQLPSVWSNLVKKCIVVDVEKRISGAGKCLEMLSINVEVPIENHKSENTSINITIITTKVKEAPIKTTNYNSIDLKTPETKPTLIQVENDIHKSHLVRNIIIGVGIIAIVVLSLVNFLNKADESSQKVTEINLVETRKLVDQIDSLNYALGFANGAGIKDFYLKGDSLEFKITSLLDAIEQSFKGEVTNYNTALGQLGIKIGTTLKEQEKTGLMGYSSLVTNFALIKQGLNDGLRGHSILMSQTESQAYLQKTISKFKSTEPKLNNNTLQNHIKGDNIGSSNSGDEIKTSNRQVEDDYVYQVIDQMPQYPGGESVLMSYIGNNLKYPIKAQENGIQGKVILRFVVSKFGLVENIEVIHSLNQACDNEALRVVKTLQRWIPGKQNGVNVSVYYTLPIAFKLE